MTTVLCRIFRSWKICSNLCRPYEFFFSFFVGVVQFHTSVVAPHQYALCVSHPHIADAAFGLQFLQHTLVLSVQNIVS